jgi:hypothetical protein
MIRMWSGGARALGAAVVAVVALGAASGADAAESAGGARDRWLDGRGAAESVLRLSGAGHDLGRQPAPVPTTRGPLMRRLRPNTISLGIQGQYGATRGSSRIADGFDQGPGYAIRFRYMLSRSAALGFSFEHQRFGSIQPPLNVPGDFADSHVVITTISGEAVLYKNRASETHPYFVIGLGYASPDVVFTDEIASRVNEGAFLTAGIGFERFVRPRISIDGSIRAYGQIANSEFTSIGQVCLGIHLYPGD